MTNSELRSKIFELKRENATIEDKIVADKREMTKVEELTVQRNLTEISDLEKQIVVEDYKLTNKVGKNREEDEQHSLTRMILNQVNGKQHNEADLKVIERGRKELLAAGAPISGQIHLSYDYSSSINVQRDTTGAVAAGSTGAGAELLREEKGELITALRGSSILLSNARFMPGLRGSYPITTYTGSTSLWKGENVTAANGLGGFIEKTLSPKRLTSYIIISKMIEVQDWFQTDRVLLDDLVASVVDKLEATAFSSDSGNTTQPAGLFNGVTYTVDTPSSAITWNNIVALESAVANKNNLLGSLKYVTTPSLFGTLKTTAKSSNTAVYLADGIYCNGYEVLRSTNVEANKMMFGNLKEITVAQFGGYDITVDNITLAADGAIRLIVNTYWDFLKRRPEAFAFADLS